MPDYVCEGYSFFRVDDKYFFEKILDIGVYFFKFFFLGDGVIDIKVWVTSTINISLHVMSYARKLITFKWILGEQHKIE